MAHAVRVSVSLPADLDERMRAAGLSPSALLAAAIRAELGDGSMASPTDRLATLEAAVKRLASRQVKSERAIGRIERRMVENYADRLGDLTGRDAHKTRP